MSEPAAAHPLLRVVLDTNVYVSGTILARGTPFRILEAWHLQKLEAFHAAFSWRIKAIHSSEYEPDEDIE